MKTNYIVQYIVLGVAAFLVCSLFMWVDWDGFISPEFGLPVMGYPAACAATLLWWMLFFSMVGFKELGNT